MTTRSEQSPPEKNVYFQMELNALFKIMKKVTSQASGLVPQEERNSQGTRFTWSYNIPRSDISALLSKRNDRITKREVTIVEFSPYVYRPENVEPVYFCVVESAGIEKCREEYLLRYLDKEVIKTFDLTRLYRTKINIPGRFSEHDSLPSKITACELNKVSRMKATLCHDYEQLQSLSP